MGYEGQIATISLGKAGMWTDSPQSDVPATFLLRAVNCQLSDDKIEKEGGSQRWNSTVYANPIIALRDFWPSQVIQRILVVTSDGSVYKMPDYFTNTLVPASGAAPALLNTSAEVSILLGGNEVAGNNRKAFILTGNDPIQVISGDGAVRTNIASGATDWSGNNQPFSGFFHRNRFLAFGNKNDPHRVYASSATNHEDFTTTPNSFSVYPGEGERIVFGFVFRTRAYVVKYPRGIYQLNDEDASSANWFFQKLLDDFGGCGPHGGVPTVDDYLLANEYGSISSLKAAFIFGDVVSSDIFHALKVYNFADNEIRKDALSNRHMVYYPSKKTVLATFQSNSNYRNDRICRMDYKLAPNQPPKISWSIKDQPNCLTLIKDSSMVERPFYGADDGYIYQLDVPDRWVGDQAGDETGYELQAFTPAMDFGQGNVLIAQQNKTFDFVEMEYEPCGDWDLLTDIYIDGRFYRTLRFNMGGRSNLDTFNLDIDSVDDGTSITKRLPCGGLGKKIALRFRQDGVGQNVKLTAVRIYYRLSGQQAEAK